jgi:NodT family efflux transporter outer membrane factor (OMF) lipoprotein
MPASLRRLVPPVLACLIPFMVLGAAPAPGIPPADPGPASDLPARWSRADAAGDALPGQELARWWEQLGDPVLDRLVRDALAGSLDLRQAVAKLRQVRAARTQARSALFPSLTASAGASDAHYGRTAGGASGTTYSAGFDAAWEADLFGANRRGAEAADADLQASAAALANARVTLVAEVAASYVDLRAAQRREAIARDNLASQSDTLQIAEWRCQAGLAADTDVQEARASREQTRAGLYDLQATQATARHHLAVLLGRSPGTLDPSLAEPAPLPRVPAAVAAGIPAGVLRQRPDLIAAERTLAAETARTRQKQAQRWPSLDLSGSFGWQAYQVSGLGTAGALVRTLAGTLSAALFDAGKLRSAVAIQDAVQEQALVSYRQRVLDALEEVENALAAYALDRDKVEALDTAATAARGAAGLSHQRYQAGLVDFRTVLESERTRLGAEDSLASAEAARLTDLIKLYKALGGGWDNVPGPVPGTQDGRP